MYTYRKTKDGLLLPRDLTNHKEYKLPKGHTYEDRVKRVALWRRWQELGLPLPDPVTGRVDLRRRAAA